jgi:hypothetical protein
MREPMSRGMRRGAAVSVALHVAVLLLFLVVIPSRETPEEPPPAAVLGIRLSVRFDGC